MARASNLISVDVFIPSAGRSTLKTSAECWSQYAQNHADILQIHPIVLLDGDVPEAASLPVEVVPMKHTGHPGKLVGDAIANSRANYIAHGFDDDPPARVADLVQACEAADALWASAKVIEIGADGEPTGVIYAGQPADSLLFRNTVPLQGCVFRRDVFRSAPFVEADTAYWNYDWELVLRLHLSRTPHAYRDAILGAWVLNPQGITSSPRTRDETITWHKRRGALWSATRGTRTS